jgi:hypothetical protein
LSLVCLSIPDSHSRKHVHDAFQRIAFTDTAPYGSSPPPTIHRVLRKAWHHLCPNSIKLTYWLLTSNSIPGGSIPPPHWRCPCSPQPLTSPSRIHSFWECPVAIAVRETISSGILHNTLHLQPRLHRSSLWLLTPSHPSVNEDFWTLVCLAAFSAMDFGRSFLWSMLTPTKTLSSPLLGRPFPTFGHAFIITFRLSGEKKQGI